MKNRLSALFCFLAVAGCIMAQAPVAGPVVGLGGGGGGTPASPNLAIQYDNAGSFGGSANLLFVPTPLSTPSAPTVSNVGTAGATTYGYEIAARSVVGSTIGSPQGTTATGNAVLDGTNYNHLSWTAVPGAVSYDVFLTTGGGNTPDAGFLANVLTTTYNHQGADGGNNSFPLPFNDSAGQYIATNLNVTGHASIGNHSQVDGAFLENIAPGPSALTVGNIFSGTTNTALSANGINVLAILDPAQDGWFSYGIIGYDQTAVGNAHNFFQVAGTWNAGVHRGTGTVTQLIGGYFLSDTIGAGHITNSYGEWVQTFNENAGATLDTAWGIDVDLAQNSGTITNYVGYYHTDVGGRNVVNPYYAWYDSRGVYRVKEDNSFNSVGQAIAALYNPQFTKYTPGLADFERVVEGRWNGNVAEIGAEAGGTGTLRDLRLIGAHVQVNSGGAANAAVCYKSDGKTLGQCASVVGAGGTCTCN